MWMDNMPEKLPLIYVHSQNQVAYQAMHQYWENFKDHVDIPTHDVLGSKTSRNK